MKNRNQEILDLIAQSIFDKKGFNILGLDVRNFSTMADFFLIAEGSVNRHVIAICRAIVDGLHDQGVSVYRMDGEQTGDWIVMDMGDIVVHLMTPDMRQKYALEELLRDGKIVKLNINTKNILGVA